MKRTILILMILAGLFQTEWVVSQQLESLQRYLFRPELVMRNQQRLGLSEQQRQSIIQEIQQAQAQFTELRWNVQNETQALERLLEARSTDEAELLAQLDKILDLERHVKRTQLILAVRIKSVLSEAQLEKLEQIRMENGEPPRRDRRPPPQNP